MPPWDWGWCLSTQMIMGNTPNIELQHARDLIFHQHFMVLALVHLTLVIGVVMEIISLRFGTITWFPSSPTHDS